MINEKTIKIINPFTDIESIPFEQQNSKNDYEQWSMGGGGANGMKADRQGLWFGSRFFSDAPFKVDMSGNVTAASLTLTGGTIKYGKTSFSDSSNVGYYIGTDGIYFGSASDATKFKFNISTGAIDYVGTASGRSTDILAAAINSSGQATDVANGIITTVKMALAAVTADVVAAGAITENKLYTGAVTADKVAANAISSVKIQAGAIVAGKIAAGAVTATEINVATISAISANLGSITSGTITGATIRTNSALYPYVNIDSSGIQIAGTSVLNFITTSGLSAGWIGGNSSQELYLYNPYNNIRIGVGSGNLLVESSLNPASDASYYLGNSSYRWLSVYTGYLFFDSTRYLTVSSSRITGSSDIVATGSLHATGNVYTGGISGAAGSVNCALLYLAPSSSHPASYGEIRNYNGGGVDQFRGIPGDGTWAGSFDMTAY